MSRDEIIGVVLPPELAPAKAAAVHALLEACGTPPDAPAVADHAKQLHLCERCRQGGRLISVPSSNGARWMHKACARRDSGHHGRGHKGGRNRGYISGATA